MELKLKRPICFFDLETTGTDVAARERTVGDIRSQGVSQRHEGNKNVAGATPGRHIPEEVSAITRYDGRESQGRTGNVRRRQRRKCMP